jgi:hypothetical protein
MGPRGPAVLSFARSTMGGKVTAMLDDIRKNHDASPTEEERSWMDADPVAGAARAMVLVGLAVMIGVVVGYSATPEEIPHAVISALSAPGP